MRKIYLFSSIISLSAVSVVLLGSFGRFTLKNENLGAQQAKLPVPMIFPEIVQGKGKIFVISQGNSEKFQMNVNLQSPASPDTQVVVYEFNPVNASLRKLTNAPFVRSFFGTCTDGNKIYIAGGYDSKWNPTKTVFEYDLITKKWNAIKDMSVARTRFALECIDGKVYAIGGEGVTSPAEIYKLETGWATLKTNYLPVGLKPINSVTSSTVVENKIYIYGENNETFQVYSPSDNLFSQGPPATFKLENFSVTAYGKRLYITGGFMDRKLNGSIRMYDFVEGAWSTVGRIPVPRYGSGLVYCNSMLMFLGGATSDNSKPVLATDEIFVYRPMK